MVTSDSHPSTITPPYHVLKLCRVTGNSITLEDALGFKSSTRLADGNRVTGQQHQQTAGEELPALTFAELKALIEQGKTDGIPNNKLIPNTLNVSPPPRLHYSPRESTSPALGCSPEREYRTDQKETMGDVASCSSLTTIYKAPDVV